MRKSTKVDARRRVNCTDLANLWGVSVAAANKMLNRQGAPAKAADGTYDLIEANKYRLARLQTKGQSDPHNLGPLDRAKLTKIELECERLRRSIARDEKQTVEASEARAAMNDIADLFVSALDSFAAQVAALTKDAALLKQCERLASDTRDAMAERIERQAEEWQQVSTTSSETSPEESEADDA